MKQPAETTAKLTLVELLTQMSPSKRNALTKQLCYFNQQMVYLKKDSAPLNLYDYMNNVYLDKSHPDAKQFDDFFLNNTIEHFYDGNNVLFKVSPSTVADISSPPQLLKIGFTEQEQRDVENQHEFSTIPAFQTNLFYETTNVYYDYDTNLVKDSEEFASSGEKDTSALLSELQYRSLEVVPFFKCNVLDYAKNHTEINVDQSLGNTLLTPMDVLHITTQMARVFQSLNQAGVFFSDSKNKNWLLDESNTLSVCDKKSLILDECLDDPNCNFYDSFGYDPLEFSEKATQTQRINVDKAHSFILGKNIYHLIKPNEPLYLELKNRKIKKLNSGSDFNFSDPFFASPIGQEFKTLIEKTVTPSNKNRLSIQAAQDVLTLLSEQYTSKTSLTEEQTMSLADRYSIRLRHCGLHNGEIQHMLNRSSLKALQQSLIPLIYKTEAMETGKSNKRDRSPRFFSYRMTPDHTKTSRFAISPKNDAMRGSALDKIAKAYDDDLDMFDSNSLPRFSSQQCNADLDSDFKSLLDTTTQEKEDEDFLIFDAQASYQTSQTKRNADLDDGLDIPFGSEEGIDDLSDDNDSSSDDDLSDEDDFLTFDQEEAYHISHAKRNADLDDGLDIPLGSEEVIDHLSDEDDSSDEEDLIKRHGPPK